VAEQDFGVVGRTPEFERIRSLPRRKLNLASALDLTPLFALREEGDFCLRPLQSLALAEAAQVGGLFCTGSVGSGKALIALLLPEALDAKRAVILTKAHLKASLLRAAHDLYGRHLRLDWKRFTVISYEQLSSAKSGGILEELQPDVIIGDECHALKHRKSARTIRFLRYAKHHPEVKYAWLSGTVARKSIRDFAHLIELALGTGSPVPNDYYELISWCGALDLDPEFPTRPGMLRTFCGPGESVREGFQRRLFETPGVVRDQGKNLVGASLVIRKRPVDIPTTVQLLVSGVQRNWKLGDREMKLAIEQAQATRQLGLGFYYKWVWPGGRPDREWLDARAEFHSEVREKLKHPRPGMDSPFLVTAAAKRYWEWVREGGQKKDKPAFCWESGTWPAWDAVRHRPPPKTETVWVSEFLVDAAIKWAESLSCGGIVWYHYRALGEKISEKGGLPLFGAGKDAELAREKVIVCSVKAQGTGKNLQSRYSQNLFTSLMPNAEEFQQTLGRTHRPGQEEDEVGLDWFDTIENQMAMQYIRAEAAFQEQTLGEKQKVLYATHL